EDSCFVYVPGPGEPPEGIGGKAAGLARLTALGENVPRWIAITALSPQAPQPASLRAEVWEALGRQGLQGKPLAVRSSALVEDGQAHSYAGQFRTALGVLPGDQAALWEAILEVQASGASDTVLAYSAPRGIGDRLAVGVVLQEMVDPSASGVAFSADPVTGDRGTVTIGAVYGLGEGLVSGMLEGDTYRVGVTGVVAGEVGRKVLAVRLSPDGGTRLEPVPEPSQEAPVLSEAEVLDIAECARRLERTLGGPQDVEWALVDREAGERQLVLLQARPITAIPTPAGERRVWDNSNIIESYHGPTTPLTFSFARGVYEEVYLQLCRVFGVEEMLLERHKDVFAHMLGLVRGRIYYNLLNWYSALSLLPGYGVNRAFMERMMGVREKLESPPAPPYVAGKAQDTLRLARMAGRLVREYHRLPWEIARFHQRIDVVLTPLAGQNLSEYSLQELVNLYRQLERELLKQWRAPLVNDFFAMVAFGVFGRLVERWLLEAPPTLLNDLLSGEGGIISTEPARRVGMLAETVRRSPYLRALFSDPDEREIWNRIQHEPELAGFHTEVRGYLHTFGERCANELKLETVTLAEDPAFLIRMLRDYAAAPLPTTAAGSPRLEAETWLRGATTGLRRAALLKVLGATRRRVRDRENLRFERTRVFGLARRIFLAIG
ncbi:MAG TPA: PEP/pyruvate-binding domain-containing protein, partial [Armatimonadota bacterium]|nr:PEP/pyruvate-binding domain-containing protein [Armatimonadota bacterium]